MNDGNVLAGIQRNGTLNPLECLGDLIAIPILRIIVERFSVPNDHYATLFTLFCDNLSHSIQVVLMWLFIRHKHDQQVRILSVR